MPGKVIPRSFDIREAGASEEVPDAVFNPSIARVAGPDGSVRTDDR